MLNSNSRTPTHAQQLSHQPSITRLTSCVPKSNGKLHRRHKNWQPRGMAFMAATFGRPGQLVAARSVSYLSTEQITGPITKDAAVEGVAQTATSTESTELLNWTHRWWPVHPVESLDKKIPMHVDLLGMSLVVWADTKGSWHCLEDKCPHRLAPLSEGRVEPQGLMCCYHGWTFDGNGSCTSIPQMAPDAEAAACSSKRACVKSYPTMVAHGLLWVWPEAGQTEAAQAAAPAVQDPAAMNSINMTAWFARDVPLRYDTLLENALDPSHVPFSHHGVQGDRYKAKEANPWGKMSGGTVAQSGFTSSATIAMGTMNIHFKAPFYLIYSLNGSQTGPQALVIPTKPGWSKIIANFPRTLSFLPPPIRALLWLKTGNGAFDHLSQRNEVIDGDTYMLHVAERQTPVSHGIGLKPYSRHYYMPAQADAAVVNMRKWIEEHAGPIPTCRPEDEPFMPPLMSKEQVLDRWNQHTKHCVHCRGAVDTLETTATIARAVGLLASIAVIAQIVAGVALANLQPALVTATASNGISAVWQVLASLNMHVSLAACGVAVVVSFALREWALKTRSKFFYQEYIHALRD